MKYEIKKKKLITYTQHKSSHNKDHHTFYLIENQKKKNDHKYY